MLKLSYDVPSKGYSCHNHSNLSDGDSTLEEMCRAAKAAGLKVFGLSDHWVVPPEDGYDSCLWSMDLSRLDSYISAMQKMKNELDDENFTLKTALEVDFFFENIDSVLKNLEGYPLDYLIGSVHYSGKFGIDTDITLWEPLTEDEKEDICEIYWQKLLGAAQRKEFSFIGHPDLPKKFNTINSKKYFPHALKVLDAVAENNGAIELNTSGWFKPCAEQYPAFDLLQAANARKIPVIVNADAHNAADVARGFEQAYMLLREAGYNY
ncbi:MAG: histidinol-phosphatase HisJ family protein [Lentisphaerae bacterium]|nr:histidinol-phosphatase HisJ family protein [Lentisphaerota bacterium]